MQRSAATRNAQHATPCAVVSCAPVTGEGVNAYRNTVTLRGYARHRGTSATSVHRAVRSGRLSKSVTWLNRVPQIADVDLADREWPIAAAAGISLRAYARHRGISATSVHRAVHSGRLSKSVTWLDGIPAISDIAMADLEWDQRRNGRTPDPRIIDPSRHPRRFVSLSVAAGFLGLNERTVRAKIECGELPARVDGRVYKIPICELVVLKRQVQDTSQRSLGD